MHFLDVPEVVKFTDCGGDITTSSGVIESPNYPENYPNNAECTWNVKLPNKQGKFGLKDDSIFEVCLTVMQILLKVINGHETLLIV